MEASGTWQAIKERIYIMEVPSYGNKLWYSFGFLALTALAILAVSGLIMVFFGPAWWLTSFWGIFFRSVHLWAAQAFVAIIIIHAAIVFLTSGFKAPRRLTWALGATVAVFALLEAEFGYGLRGDFSSQYRALQAADFWNGANLGNIVNTLNFAQVYGIHIIDIPIIIAGLLFFHYLLVKARGIAKPYRADFSYRMVPADHKKLFIRGGVLGALILLFAIVFPSPLVAPATVSGVAGQDPSLVAQTLMGEFTRTSGTATYMDTMDPYRFDTRAVYVAAPYAAYVAATGARDDLAAFNALAPDVQQADIQQASDYFANGGAVSAQPDANPLVPAISSLVGMAKSGLYESALDSASGSAKPAYTLRFLADTGVLDDEATQLHITTEQWGMMREESGAIPPGAWWLAPLGALDHTVLETDENGDRDGAGLLGFAALLFIFFPFIPYVNRIPEKLHIAERIWKEKSGA